MTPRIPQILGEPWILLPAKFNAVCEVYERHLSGEKLDLSALGTPSKTVMQGSNQYAVENGIATIEVQGVLAKRMNLLTQISGGTSTELLTQAVQDATNDPAVSAILLLIDSPGGQVDGTQQLASAVAVCAKPTAAFVDGMACSAAFWIATQCDLIYASSDTSEVGSLGVVIKHADYSKADEASGKKTTHIVTGKFKAAGNSSQPLSQDDRDYLQQRADYVYTLFLGEAASGLGMTPEALDTVAGDAQVFFAQQAIDAGLIDGIASEQQVRVELAKRSKQPTQTPSGAKQETIVAFKTFQTEAEYNAEIAAAEARGAEQLSPQAAYDKLRSDISEGALKLTAYIAKARGEGRKLNAAQAHLEMKTLGLL